MLVDHGGVGKKQQKNPLPLQKCLHALAMHSTAYISSVKLSRQKREQKSAVTVGSVGAFVAFITFLWIYLNIFLILINLTTRSLILLKITESIIRSCKIVCLMNFVAMVKPFKLLNRALG